MSLITRTAARLITEKLRLVWPNIGIACSESLELRASDSGLAKAVAPQSLKSFLPNTPQAECTGADLSLHALGQHRAQLRGNVQQQ